VSISRKLSQHLNKPAAPTNIGGTPCHGYMQNKMQQKYFKVCHGILKLRSEIKKHRMSDKFMALFILIHKFLIIISNNMEAKLASCFCQVIVRLTLQP
jgi:hypothetical protein